MHPHSLLPYHATYARVSVVSVIYCNYLDPRFFCPYNAPNQRYRAMLPSPPHHHPEAPNHTNQCSRPHPLCLLVLRPTLCRPTLCPTLVLPLMIPSPSQCGVIDNLLKKDHTHMFVNNGGDVRDLDFRFPVGAPLHGINAFLTTPQLNVEDKIRNSIVLATSPVVKALFDDEGAMRDIRELDKISFSDWFLSKGGNRNSLTRMWDPIAYALGFLDCDDISARCMLTIFKFFATKTDASKLRMLNGSPADYLHAPISKYITDRGGKFHLRTGCREIMYEDGPDGVTRVTGLRLTKAGKEEIVKADAYVAACDVPGIKKLLPSGWRKKFDMIDRIYNLEGVAVITVQLRYDGWVTELKDAEKARTVGPRGTAAGLDNLLYSADVGFSCFADLALTSPESYFKEGEGSLMQCVLTPADTYNPLSNDEIIRRVDQQVRQLFPSAKDFKCTWGSVVKIAQSLYREAPGNDKYRPSQHTPIENFFLAGSYTMQDYIDSMEGATISGRQCADEVLKKVAVLAK
eukprot:jgi/Mesvir1/13841/Mv15987-RA.1